MLLFQNYFSEYKRKPAHNKNKLHSKHVTGSMCGRGNACVSECVMTQDSHVTYEHNTSKTERTPIFSCWQPSRGANNFLLRPNSQYGASCHIQITVCPILFRFAAQLEAQKALDIRFRVRNLFGSRGTATRFCLTAAQSPIPGGEYSLTISIFLSHFS